MHENGKVRRAGNDVLVPRSVSPAACRSGRYAVRAGVMSDHVSVGRARCQGEGRGFESRRPLHRNPWPSQGFLAVYQRFRASRCQSPLPIGCPARLAPSPPMTLRIAPFCVPICVPAGRPWDPARWIPEWAAADSPFTPTAGGSRGVADNSAAGVPWLVDDPGFIASRASRYRSCWSARSKISAVSGCSSR
jgi:hypothetical protein